MPSVDDIVAGILRREGGFVNDPDDPGGATNYGVTLATMRRLGLDLDRDGDVDVQDVRALSREQAGQIFKTEYYRKPKIDQLPAALRPSVFDMYVNAGGAAITILQKLLAEFGFRVAVDGVLGPQTIGAAHGAMQKAPQYFVDAYGIARRNYYYRLADRRPGARKYARRRDGGKGGWILRAEEFISERFRLTDAQHRARVAAWG